MYFGVVYSASEVVYISKFQYCLLLRGRPLPGSGILHELMNNNYYYYCFLLFIYIYVSNSQIMIEI